jgi:hypothetical protein
VALKRWRWVLSPLLAALILAVLALPPRVPVGEGLLGRFFGPGDYDYVPQDPTRAAVRDAIRTQSRRLIAQRLADSLAAAARRADALHSADGAVTVVYEPPITRDSARTWLAAAEAELGLYPRPDTTTGLPVVVALRATPVRSRDANERILLSPALLGLQGAATSSGACVVVINLAQDMPDWYARRLVAHDAARRPLGRFLDACALYGRYGLPGAAVATWAERGPSWYWGGYDRLSLRVQEARRSVRRDTVVAVLTSSSFWQGGLQWAPIACLRGGTATCARLADLSGLPSGLFWWSFRLTRGQVLAWLVAQGSPAQFARFWRSRLPPAQAIEAAYGEPAGRLAMAAFRHWASPPGPGGPRAGGRVVVGGVLWAALALGLALVAGRRWTTEI